MVEHGVGFIAFSPLNQGLLLHKYRPEHPPEFPEGDHRRGKQKFSREGLAAIEPKLQKLEERFGDTAGELVRVALQYVLSHSRVAAVIPGFRDTEQVRASLAAAGRPLSRADLAYIREVFA
jgi:aryl-alcohol dehydrogenase-like predicted oxidoreductase